MVTLSSGKAHLNLITIIMTKSNFISLCGLAFIAPEIAIENDKVFNLLKEDANINSPINEVRMIDLLVTEF